MWWAALLLSAGFNQCIDERPMVALPIDAPVCEEGLSLEDELRAALSDDEQTAVASEPKAIRRQRFVLRASDERLVVLPTVPPAPKPEPPQAAEPQEPPEPAADGPYLTASGMPSADLLLDPLDPTEPPRYARSYAPSEFRVPVQSSEPELIEDIEFDMGPGWYGTDYHTQDRLINVMLSRPTRRGRLQMVIQHRTTQPVLESTVRDFGGFDSGLKVGLGLRLGLLRGVDVGVLRVNGIGEPYDVYEYDARVAYLGQDGFAAGARGGATTFYDATKGTSGSWFFQVGLERHIVDERLLLVINTSFHSDSSSQLKKATDVNGTCNIAGGAEVRISDRWALTAEALYGMLGFAHKYPAVSVASKWYSHRHAFTLVLTNTSQMSFDGLVANTTAGELRETRIGFNITREFDLYGDG